MSVLILGAAGMLGHKIFQRLSDACGAVRSSADEARSLAPGLFSEDRLIAGVDCSDFARLESLLNDRRPRVVINCVGVIKQRPEAKNAIPSIAINALLPHLLAAWLERWNGRLIHFSTDCVFSGQRGAYSEADVADATDLYGRTKFLGEVHAHNALTLRTSIIGRELEHFQSLLEWFLSRAEAGAPAKGFTRAVYSGVTTNYLADLVARLIEDHPRLHGLYQVTAPAISKFELLRLLRDAYGKNIEIVADDSVFCDRSMNGDKFIAATGYRSPAWPELVAQLARDTTPYEQWRRHVRQAI